MMRTVNNEEYLVLFAKGLYMDRLMRFLCVDTPKQAVEMIENGNLGKLRNKLASIEEWAAKCQCDRPPHVSVKPPAGCGYGDGWE